MRKRLHSTPVQVEPFEKGDVVLLPYDPRLPEVAEVVQQLIAPITGDSRVTHFGSTSVPGLTGKNIVDIEIEYRPGGAQQLRDGLEQLGFVFADDAGWPQDGWYLYRGAITHDGQRFRLHLHVIPRGGEPVRQHRHFRGLLRSSSGLCEEYVALKHEILASGVREPRAFSAAKSGWMASVLERHPVPPPDFAWFCDTLELDPGTDLAGVVEAVRALPYGRTADRTGQAVAVECRGTCSTKHALLRAVIAERWPETAPRIVHRVYRLMPADARARFGDAVAGTVPADGLVDVHRYLVLTIDGRDVPVDATFPGGPAWDGRSPMPLACGPGDDYPAGVDADADKRALEDANCDPAVREPFIAALSSPPAA